MSQFTGLIGIAVFLVAAWLLSADRARISWRLVGSGLALQFIIAALCLRVPGFVTVFDWLARVFTRVISFADQGIIFLFGKVADPSGPWGFVFAVKVLPVIVFFASLMAVLYHVRAMQPVVAGLAWVLRRALGVTGAEAVSAAVNVFVGQTEAPLTVKPYLAGMTRSQLMAIMTGGFASIAGSVMAAYVGLLGGESEESRVLFAKHLITASVMSAPAGLVMAKIMLPETEAPRDESLASLMGDRGPSVNLIDAAATGATDGLKLALNVAAMLCAFVALIALVNGFLGWCVEGLSLQRVLGLVLSPVAWTMGVPAEDTSKFGALLGIQVIATEFNAYVDLSKHVSQGTMSRRSVEIATYALCGFANLPSIAIQIGGLSALVPERRPDFVRLAPRAMLAGALACWTTGAVAGILI